MYVFFIVDAKVEFYHHSHQQMTEFLQEQAKRCSSIMKLTTIGTSKGGKPLYGLKVTENPELRKTKPQVGLVGSLEGTDITGKELLLKLVEYLCSRYEQKDDQIKTLLQSTVLHIVPAVDVDGNEKATEGDCEGHLKPMDDLSRSFYFNLTSSDKSLLPKNIKEVSSDMITFT